MELKVIPIISPDGESNSELWIVEGDVSLALTVNSEQALFIRLRGKLNEEDENFINTTKGSVYIEDVPINLKRILVSSMLMTLINKVL